MLKYILLAIVIAITEILTYKIIKIIDKRERKKLYKWELEYIKKIKELKGKSSNNNSKNDTTENISNNTNNEIIENERSEIK